MRVLQIVTHMNRGGLETMIMNYYRQIDREKVQFDFLVHREVRADYDDEIESLGGRIYRLPLLNPFSKDYKHKLQAFFNDHPEYRVVHCHLDCMSAIPLGAAKNAGVPTRIAHSHNTSQDHNLKFLLKLYYKRKIPKAATKLFSCSEEAGKWMFNGAPFEVLPNAINAADYSFNLASRDKIRTDLDINDAPVFGHIGRFNPQKNHSFLIDIFSAIQKQIPNAKLLLVGGGDGMEDIKAKVNALKLQDNLIFTGVRADVADLLQAMDVFIFPSHYEGLPVTLIEAQAAGLPCLISDGVPIECKKTDLIEQLALSIGAEQWAKRAIDMLKITRKNTYPEIYHAGFDVVENAKRLQNFYLRAESGETDLCL